MTPAARLAAIIDLLGQVQESKSAADRLLSDWQRANRYAGAKDRRAIAEGFYAALREQGARRWRIAEAGAGLTPRLLAMADGETPLEQWQSLCTGQGYAPPPLSDEECRVLGTAPAAPPLNARLNLPDWLGEKLAAQFGDGFEAEMAAMAGRAPADLRVNRLKAGRAEVLARLEAEGIAAEPTPYSPLGIRLAQPIRLETHPLYREGLIEPQDEAAQLAGLLVDARPGQLVVDLCAGAGGKTLLLAAEMKDRGRLIATDNNDRRLARLGPRLARAGLSCVEAVPAARLVDTVVGLAGQADRVLLDVPCSGSGTWRRNPEARWRLSQSTLDELREVQLGLLRRGWSLLKPGGKLLYATCSLLAEENDGIVDAFRASHADVTEPGIETAWPAGEAGAYPWPGEARLRLTPRRHNTDGFFAALLAKPAAGPV